MRNVLYRFYADEDLLYVGITLNLPARWDAHAKDKPWWSEVTRCTVGHYDSREAAEAAERDAIRAEAPRYNVVHNRGNCAAVPARQRDDGGKGRRWWYENVRYGNTFSFDEIWLYPELNCSPMVDDYCDLSGEEQLEEYVRYIRDKYPQYWEQDAVPIYWGVDGSPGYGISETAPFHPYTGQLHPEEDFLTHFTWPEDMRTGERLDWFRLPVRYSRFPEFGRALGWVPSPLQPYAPLRSIMASRHGWADMRWGVAVHGLQGCPGRLPQDLL